MEQVEKINKVVAKYLNEKAATALDKAIHEMVEEASKRDFTLKIEDQEIVDREESKLDTISKENAKLSETNRNLENLKSRMSDWLKKEESNKQNQLRIKELEQEVKSLQSKLETNVKDTDDSDPDSLLSKAKEISEGFNEDIQTTSLNKLTRNVSDMLKHGIFCVIFIENSTSLVLTHTEQSFSYSSVGGDHKKLDKNEILQNLPEVKDMILHMSNVDQKTEAMTMTDIKIKELYDDADIATQAIFITAVKK